MGFLTGHPILMVLAAAVLAPVLAQTPATRRIPVIVIEVLLGFAIGSQALGLVEPDPFLTTMKGLGIAAVLFMAGMEVDFAELRGRPIALASRAWAISIALGVGAILLFGLALGVNPPFMITVALTSTALGSLFPVLRDSGMLKQPFGRNVLAAATVAEVGSLVVASIVLSTQHPTWRQLVFLAGFLAVVALVALTGIRARHPRLLDLLSRTFRSTNQLPVRLTLLVLGVLFVLADELGFEGVLGAFAAGMVVRLATQDEAGETFRAKLDAVCFGWMSPFFYIGTGMGLDLAALRSDMVGAAAIPAFLALFLLVRGLPVLLYRNEVPRALLPAFATALSVAPVGMVTVFSNGAVAAGGLPPNLRQSLILAAIGSLLVYPTLTSILLARGRPASH